MGIAGKNQKKYLDMTPFKKKILIVDDQIVNRLLLHKILDTKYDVIEADSGNSALLLIREHKDVIQAVLLDLIMPGMDGYTFLEIVKADSELQNIPIIITTQSEGVEVEIRALELGAADYITKPYNNIVILQRLTNIIALRENAILRNTSEKDPLTSLYNKETFYKKVPEHVLSNPDTQYVILYMDVERFKIVNDFFGEKEGDKLLCYIAQVLADYSDPTEMICSRHTADIFVICMPYVKEKIETYVDTIVRVVNEYPLKFRLTIDFGVYVIENIEIPVNVMCDRASLALENVVGKYGENLAYYDDSHRELLVEEQSIVNEMTNALREGQFHVYMQPKFDLRDFSIIGAESLVRWVHPTKGFIGPDKFIPIFESNGFITELDFFVWETTCKHLREWLDKGYPIVPVSVNVSRVDIYRPDICDLFSNLLKKYNLPVELLELEITETSYTQNAEQLIETVTELKKIGFRISMDDFGSGYSSLNMLNEVPVDVLKVDMTLLRNIDEKNKSSNIINFVVSMAKWLNLPVISEGVETIEQVNFLLSIGCHKGQGYFFSRPLPVKDFEEKMLTHKKEEMSSQEAFSTFVNIDDVWDSTSQFNKLFNSFVGSLALYEFKGDTFALLRANKQFYKEVMPNGDELYSASANLLPCIHEEDRDIFIQRLQDMRGKRGEDTILLRMAVPGLQGIHWHRMQLKILYDSEDSVIFLGLVEDMSTVKSLEATYEKSEQRLNTLFETCNMSTFGVDFTNKTLTCDALGKEMYGFGDVMIKAAETFINDGFICKPNVPEIHSFFSGLFGGQKSGKMKLQCKKLDGSVHSALLFYKTEFDVQKKPVSALCVLHCIDNSLI